MDWVSSLVEGVMLYLTLFVEIEVCMPWSTRYSLTVSFSGNRDTTIALVKVNWYKG